MRGFFGEVLWTVFFAACEVGVGVVAEGLESWWLEGGEGFCCYELFCW